MKRVVLLFGLFFLCNHSFAHAQQTLNTAGPASEKFGVARVLSIDGERDEVSMGMNRLIQTVRLRMIQGVDEGKEWIMDNVVLDSRADMRLATGQNITVERMEKADGSIVYLTREHFRLPSLWILLAFFLALAFIFGGVTGLTSLLGLAVSGSILVFYVVPSIVAGSNPLHVSIVGAVLIACTSLYLAHGFTKRTSVALLSTLLTLCISIVLAIAFVHLMHIYGMGSEEAMYLQMGLLQNVDLRGLLLGGIIIGALGVLDDITTAQTASIAEVAKANPLLSFRELYRSGAAVGKEHIASLINTLALAYAGASFPLLLLLKTNNDWPLWMTLNSEFMTEEIVRTLVGSSTLLFAVPISTLLAAWFFQGGKNSGRGFAHHHHHA